MVLNHTDGSICSRLLFHHHPIRNQDHSWTLTRPPCLDIGEQPNGNDTDTHTHVESIIIFCSSRIHNTISTREGGNRTTKDNHRTLRSLPELGIAHFFSSITTRHLPLKTSRVLGKTTKERSKKSDTVEQKPVCSNRLQFVHCGSKLHSSIFSFIKP